MAPKQGYDIDTLSNIENRLQSILEANQTHGLKDATQRITQLLRDCKAPLLVMVVGKGNFGKSTLINGLMGKEVAPVSRLPKTWKVDLYENVSIDVEESAVLSWQSKPDAPQMVSVADAKQVSDAEEEKACRSDMLNSEPWRSDLTQIHWRLHADWPGDAVAFVDTPGFSQHRANVDLQSFKLYGASGIEVVASDAFHHWYYRADVVLWCLDASRLHDQDTIDALEATKQLNKRIVGILTRMDRVPMERWDEVLSEAQTSFGMYIPRFLVSAAGASGPERESTVQSLRGTLKEDVFPDVGLAKLQALQQNAENEISRVKSTLGSIQEATIENVALVLQLEKAIAASKAKISRTVDKALETVSSPILNKAIDGVPALYTASENLEVFKSNLQRCIDTRGLQTRLGEVLGSFQKSLKADAVSFSTRLRWKALKLTQAGSETQYRQASIASPSVKLPKAGGVTVDLDEMDGAAVSAGIGGAAALAGAALLGPVGLLAGLVGVFAHGSISRGEHIKKAKKALTDLVARQTSGVQRAADRTCTRFYNELDEIVWKSFREHHGGDIDELLNRAILADVSYSVVGSQSDVTPKAVIPSNLHPQQKTGCASWFAYRIASVSGPAMSKWNAACASQWKPELDRAFVRQTFGQEGEFRPCSGEQWRSSLSRAYAKHVDDEVRSTLQYEKHCTIFPGCEITIANLHNILLRKLPSFSSVSAGAQRVCHGLPTLLGDNPANIQSSFTDSIEATLTNEIEWTAVGYRSELGGGYAGHPSPSALAAQIVPKWLTSVYLLLRKGPFGQAFKCGSEDYDPGIDWVPCFRETPSATFERCWLKCVGHPSQPISAASINQNRDLLRANYIDVFRKALRKKQGLHPKSRRLSIDLSAASMPVVVLGLKKSMLPRDEFWETAFGLEKEIPPAIDNFWIQMGRSNSELTSTDIPSPPSPVLATIVGGALGSTIACSWIPLASDMLFYVAASLLALVPSILLTLGIWRLANRRHYRESTESIEAAASHCVAKNLVEHERRLKKGLFS